MTEETTPAGATTKGKGVTAPPAGDADATTQGKGVTVTTQGKGVTSAPQTNAE